MVKTVRQFISHLFIVIWAYFPGIIICLLLYNIFWSIAQSRDLLYAHSINKDSVGLFILAALFMFYTIWHSSEIVGINKVKRNASIRVQNDLIPPSPGLQEKVFLYPSKKFFGTASIILGYIAYSIIIASFFRIEGYTIAAQSKASFTINFLVFFVIQYCFYIFLNRINEDNQRKHPENKYIKYLAITVTLLAVFYYIYNVYFQTTTNYYTIPITGILTVFIVQLIRKILLIRYNPDNIKISNFSLRVIRFFSVQNKFAVSFLIFNIIGVAVFLIYAVCVSNIDSVQTLGPLTFLLMAVGIIIGAINFIIFLSIKVGFNIYVFIFIFALLFGQKENHFVRTIPVQKETLPHKKPLSEHLQLFFQQFDSTANYEIPMYFVLANGGASRAAWWTGGLLSHIEANTKLESEKSFYQHLFAISSASGGSVGAASFLYQFKAKSTNDTIYNSIKKVFEQDLLSPGLSYLLSFDLGRYLFPIAFSSIDRNIKLEQAFDKAMGIDQEHIPIQYLFTNEAYSHAPIFAFNVTRMQDGAPGVVSNLNYTSTRYNNRIDVLSIIHPDSTLTISSAAFLSARFPYISPAGRINSVSGAVHYYVDGGYFDNSGAGFIQELLIETKAMMDENPAFEKFRNRVKFQVLHIKNSASGVRNLEKTLPIQNDLLSPITTIMGAYDMQTNTNDYRLINFVHSQKMNYDTLVLVDEQRFRYPMNWVLSEFVMNRMDSMIQVQSKVFTDKYQISRFD